MNSKYIRKILLMLFSAIFIIGLSGCGNSSDKSVTTTINGTISGSFYEGANVCFDTNNDGSCRGETIVTSDVNGNFTLTENGLYSIIAEIPTNAIKHTIKGDTGVEIDSNSKTFFAMPVATIDNAKSAADGKVIVSSISTMLYTYMIENPTTNVNDAINSVSKVIGVSNDNLLKDFNSPSVNKGIRDVLKRASDKILVAIKGKSSLSDVESVIKILEHSPVANDDNITIAEDSGSHIINVLANDTDVDAGDTLTIGNITQPEHGSVIIGDGGLNLSYTPNANFNGTDTFTYTAKDSAGLTSTATVTVMMTNNDFDNDFIPDNIEDYLGMDKNNSDQNNNGIVDGLESSIDSISDQFFNKQWHIQSLGTQVNPYPESLTIEGNDLNIVDIYHNYMGYNNGNPLVVQVVDTGVDANHEDLVQNMDLYLSRDSDAGKMGDPIETGTHGTKVAGIIGARAFNGKGVRGIAPFVKIAGSNWIGYQSAAEIEEVWTKNDPDAKIILASNSWGTDSASPDTLYEDLMSYAANNLRKVDGVARGKLFIKAAVNGRLNNHDSGLSYTSSNPYVITVAALKNNNTYASYSSPGSNILVSGYSGNFFNDSATIATTTVTGTSAATWDEDTNHNYTYGMNGTSAATPTVAGCLALVLEACPTLMWRDVKYLIAKDAIKIDSTNSSWQTNAVGLHHSVDYGFGLINPKGMIEECKSGYTPLPSSTTFTESFDPDPDIAIPDNDENGISYTFTVSNSKTIEWLGVTIYSDHTYGGDLEIYLISPSGTKTRLMLGNNSGNDYSLSEGFRYGSVAFMGEQSAGNWTLKIVDIEEENAGSLQKIDFEVFGH